MKLLLSISIFIFSSVLSADRSAPLGWTWSEPYPWVYSHKASEWLWIQSYPWMYSSSTYDWTYHRECANGAWTFQNCSETVRYINDEPNIESTAKLALTQVGLDYLEGFLTGDTALMEDTIHDQVVVRGPSDDSFITLTKVDLMSFASGNSEELEEGAVTVSLIDMIQETALLRVDGPDWYEHCQVAFIDDEWIVLNAFFDGWDKPSGDGTCSFTTEEAEIYFAEESVALVAAGMNYVEGFMTGDLERIQLSMHPNLVKRRPHNNAAGFYEMDLETLLSLASGWSEEPGSTPIEITILDVLQDTALILTKAPDFYDYCQLFKINGTWQIVNVLWDTWD